MDVAGKRIFRFRCVSLVHTCSFKPVLYEGKNTTFLAVFPELGLLYVRLYQWRILIRMLGIAEWNKMRQCRFR
jgi:hypothetical protein